MAPHTGEGTTGPVVDRPPANAAVKRRGAARRPEASPIDGATTEEKGSGNNRKHPSVRRAAIAHLSRSALEDDSHPRGVIPRRATHSHIRVCLPLRPIIKQTDNRIYTGAAAAPRNIRRHEQHPARARRRGR
jgi:hypothetical protein